MAMKSNAELMQDMLVSVGSFVPAEAKTGGFVVRLLYPEQWVGENNKWVDEKAHAKIFSFIEAVRCCRNLNPGSYEVEML